MAAFTTGALIGTIVVLAYLITKLLGILVGTLIVYFAPILLIFGVLAAWGYFRFTRRGQACVKRVKKAFGNGESK